MRKEPFITGSYYHIYNRGVDKRDIFSSKKDVDRFVLSIKKFNSLTPIGSMKEILLYKNKNSGAKHPNMDQRLVSIVCFCLNPNHFHFILKQEVDGGISEFMKRLSGGYTNYFNTLYGRSGSLFQGRFKSCMVSSDQYFLKIFPYVNVNFLIHDMPASKRNLVLASDQEYNNTNFKIVSEVEATNLLEAFGGLDNFQEECKKVVDIIREERGKDTIFLEE